MSFSTWIFRSNDRKAKTIAMMKQASAAFERSSNVVFKVVSRLIIIKRLMGVVCSLMPPLVFSSRAEWLGRVQAMAMARRPSRIPMRTFLATSPPTINTLRQLVAYKTVSSNYINRLSIVQIDGKDFLPTPFPSNFRLAALHDLAAVDFFCIDRTTKSSGGRSPIVLFYQREMIPLHYFAVVLLTCASASGTVMVYLCCISHHRYDIHFL